MLLLWHKLFHVIHIILGKEEIETLQREESLMKSPFHKPPENWNPYSSLWIQRRCSEGVNHSHSRMKLVEKMRVKCLMYYSLLTVSNEESLTCNTESLKEGQRSEPVLGTMQSSWRWIPEGSVRTIVETSRTLLKWRKIHWYSVETQKAYSNLNVSYIQQEVENLHTEKLRIGKNTKQALGLSSEVLQNVGLQSSCEAKDIFQPPRVKKLMYPQLPTEIAADVPALVAVNFAS